MMLCAIMGFTACSNDDDPTQGVEEGLVSETVPSTEGWSGSLENGIATYTPSGYYDYDGYYAFSFKDGICGDAVFNMICESEEEASYLCDLLNNGSFDDLETKSCSTEAPETSVLAQSLKLLKLVKKTLAKGQPETRADLLGISCSQSGKVVFFKLECFRNKSGEVVRTAINAWESDFDISSLPETPLFGTYDRSTGKYVNDNIMGIANTKYEISTQFSGDILTEFVTTLSLPNATWATLLEESFNEQVQDYIDIFGDAPEISRNGNTVTVKAIIVGEVQRVFVEQYIVMLDLIMNKPIAVSLM